jgi:antitoxin MazE
MGYPEESEVMISKIQKWGNSQGLRLSKDVLELASFGVGDEVEIAVGVGEIVVKKVKVSKPKFDLAELVARIPKGYKPHEEWMGPPVGKEEW